MKSLAEITNGLVGIDGRHKTLKNLFTVFQGFIKYIGNSIQGIKILSVDGKDKIIFIDREYEFTFSSEMVAYGLKGIITFERVLDEETTIHVGSIIFDDKEEAYIEQYEGEQTFLISSDNDCIVAVLNLLFININTQHIPK